MKKRFLIILVTLLWCNVVNASTSLKCENVDPKATLDYARVEVDLNKKRFYYNWLGGYMTITAVTPDRINAMDIDMVVNKIYNAFIEEQEELILDGRKK